MRAAIAIFAGIGVVVASLSLLASFGIGNFMLIYGPQAYQCIPKEAK